MSGTKKNWKTCHKRIWNWIWYSKRFKESFLLPFVFVETFKFTAQLPKLSLKLLEAKLIFHRSVKWFLCLNKCFLSRCRSSNYRLWQQRMPARKFPSKSIKSFLPFCVAFVSGFVTIRHRARFRTHTNVAHCYSNISLLDIKKALATSSLKNSCASFIKQRRDVESWDAIFNFAINSHRSPSSNSINFTEHNLCFTCEWLQIRRRRCWNFSNQFRFDAMSSSFNRANLMNDSAAKDFVVVAHDLRIKNHRNKSRGRLQKT